MKTTFQILATFLMATLMSGLLLAQSQAELDIIDRNVRESANGLEMIESDIAEYEITSYHTSQRSGITHYYLRQTHQGIPVYNAVMNVHLDAEGDLFKMNNQFLRNIESKINTNQPTLDAQTAISRVARTMQYDMSELPRLEEQKSASRSQEQTFTKGSISRVDIPVQLMYQPMEDGTLRLAWDMSIAEMEDADWWSMRVDAQTGEILHQHNWTVYCNFDVDQCAEEGHVHHYPAEDHTMTSTQQNIAAPNVANTYNVFDEPVESPIHGGRTLVTTTGDPIASPFGWHDTNGATGAEFTITRGNNVWAQEDANGNDGTGFSPDGGASLDFNFGLNLNSNPNSDPARSAGITNLFYWNNLVHDVWYQYGFDEASGNFQENNYGRGGSAGDGVFADAQDGGGTNNANFSSPGDGSNGRMQMFLWTGASSGTLTVNSPGSIAGGYGAAAAQFGQGSYNVTGNLVIVSDGSGAPTEGCGALTNAGAISGNIAVVDRGNCEFGTKCLNAQNAGAIAVIVCNNVAGGTLAMAPGADGANVNIPAVMISQAECATIRAQIPTVNVNLVSGSAASRDGDLDNGIIAHEYGHGISIRLTGGRNNSGCLGNSEQMGEGWSDWFGLMMTIDPTDTRNDVRPIGTFALGQSTTGSGIRTFPYTTDMGVNTHVYTNIGNEAIPHGVGSVWCAMLWEMTWDLIDTYGFDPDLHNGTGGNNIAMALVTEGLKLQPCSPGFVDGRDAILAADQALYNGANQCLIRDAFGRRGLGDNANQGSTNSSTDGSNDFNVNCGPPTCSDGTLNQDEVGVDCGGATCPACPADVCSSFGFGGIISYDANDNDQGTATLNGNEVLITGNGWKAIPINYTFTASTVLTFEFRSTVQGEIHEVAFDNDLIFTPDHRIVIYGNQGFTGDFANPIYTGSGNWETFTIQVGTQVSGPFQYMVLTADDDATGNGISEFRNIQLFEDNNNNQTCDEAPPSCAGVDLDINFDGFPTQTSWEITDDATGAVVGSGGSYGNTLANSNLGLSNVSCLPDGCYTLTFADAISNGMCPFRATASSSGVFVTPGTVIIPGTTVATLGTVVAPGLCGNYTLTDVGGTVLASGGGRFGASESNSFCISGGLAVPLWQSDDVHARVQAEGTSNTLEVLPNPAKDNLTIFYNLTNDLNIDIHIVDITGKIVREITRDAMDTKQVQLNVNDLTAGFYFVRLVSGDTVLSKKFMKQ